MFLVAGLQPRVCQAAANRYIPLHQSRRLRLHLLDCCRRRSKQLDISARYCVPKSLRYFFDLLLSQPNLVCGSREQLFEVIDQHDDLVDELLQFGSMIDTSARGFQERRAILSLDCQFSHLIVEHNDTRVHGTGRIRCEVVTKLRILSTSSRSFRYRRGEQQSGTAYSLQSGSPPSLLPGARACHRRTHRQLVPADETKSRAIQCEEICLEVSPEVVAELNVLETINTGAEGGGMPVSRTLYRAERAVGEGGRVLGEESPSTKACTTTSAWSVEGVN